MYSCSPRRSSRGRSPCPPAVRWHRDIYLNICGTFSLAPRWFPVDQMEGWGWGRSENNFPQNCFSSLVTPDMKGFIYWFQPPHNSPIKVYIGKHKDWGFAEINNFSFPSRNFLHLFPYSESTSRKGLKILKGEKNYLIFIF